jgi:formate hydrogenlyase transcriptional activator
MDIDRSAERYRLLLEINNAIISNLTRESLFHAISEALRAAVPFDRAVLYDSENEVLRTFALEGRDLHGHSHTLHKHVSRHGTAVGWAFENRQPRLRSNLELEPRLPGDDILLDGGVRSYLIVPLMARGRAIGALLLASFVSNRYSPADVPLVEEVAKQIALAVDNMQAYCHGAVGRCAYDRVAGPGRLDRSGDG